MNGLIRLTKTWAKHTAADIVKSAYIVQCGGGNWEITTDLPGLEGMILLLTDGDQLVLDALEGPVCRMALDDESIERMIDLTASCEAKLADEMRASFG